MAEAKVDLESRAVLVPADLRQCQHAGKALGSLWANFALTSHDNDVLVASHMSVLSLGSGTLTKIKM